MPNNYVLLETIALTQSAASVTFDNLPTSGYTDLKIVISGRDDRASQPNGDVALQVIYNGTVNTGSIYTQRRLYGSPGTGAGSDSTSATSLPLGMLDSTTATANTFGNMEIYISNYMSSNNKSVSCDGVSENNGTVAFQVFNAGLIATSNPITGIKLFSNLGTNLLANSTFSLYGIAAYGTTPVLAPKATGGNIVANDGTYWYHAFTSSGYFVPQVGLTADVLVVAGGGGGGCWNGGGGGAGGLLYFSGQSVSTSKSITIGAGGVGSTANAVKGTSGTSSIFEGLTTVVGGGGGGTNANEAGLNGGSGGGSVAGTAAGTPTTGQGFAGSVGGTNSPFIGGGGGGAGEAGGTDGTGFGGDGINTYSSWLSPTNLGVSGFIAGGGAGGFYDFTARKTGGDGGGGDGGTRTPATKDGLNAVASTGSGGGGGGYGTPTGNEGFGGNGASGVILIRYPIA